MKRKKSLTNVHKSNVLKSSVLWNEVLDEVHSDYPEVSVDHILVDAAATYLCLNPTRFDVMVMENMFGDILSDQCGGILGSLGLMPSACVRPGAVLLRTLAWLGTRYCWQRNCQSLLHAGLCRHDARDEFQHERRSGKSMEGDAGCIHRRLHDTRPCPARRCGESRSVPASSATGSSRRWPACPTPARGRITRVYPKGGTRRRVNPAGAFSY